MSVCLSVRLSDLAGSQTRPEGQLAKPKCQPTISDSDGKRWGTEEKSPYSSFIKTRMDTLLDAKKVKSIVMLESFQVQQVKRTTDHLMFWTTGLKLICANLMLKTILQLIKYIPIYNQKKTIQLWTEFCSISMKVF